MTWLALLGALWLATAFVLAPLIGRCIAESDRRAVAAADERMDRDLRRFIGTASGNVVAELDDPRTQRPAA